MVFPAIAFYLIVDDPIQHLVFVLDELAVILEHINYYRVQISIDNAYDIKYVVRNRRLKTASLAKDVREGWI